MTTSVSDTAVAAALEGAVGHPAPWSTEELGAVRRLRVVGARAIDEVAECAGLEHLEIIGSDVADLAPLAPLVSLRSLHVSACPVTSAEGLRGLRCLEELHLDFAFLEEADPILALPSLRRARLVGNPWSAESWARLRAHGADASTSEAPRPLLELGAEREFDLEVTRRLRAIGLDLCFGTLDLLRTVLVRPGCARTAGQACDWSLVAADDVWLDGRGEWTSETLFDAVRDFRQPKGDESQLDLASHREFGDRSDALRWIAEEPEPARRDSLRRFVDHFPGAVFFREDEAFHSMIEQHAGVALPAAFRGARQVLAGAFPERAAGYRLDRFAGSSPRVSSLPEIWYRPHVETYGSDEGPVIRDTARVYPFALWPVQKRSLLAVALDDPDGAIREYGETDVFDALRAGQPARAALHRVFSSHAELLAHIAAFKLADGTVIEARGDGAGAKD